MLYFIPAWYKENSIKWEEKEQTWYTRRLHTEYDDSVKQIQLFHRNGGTPYKILLLSHAPNFRHFLHRQGVFHANYWSCFDAIQEVEKKSQAILSFHNIAWPEGIEFVYSPFAIVAFQNGVKYAKIEFGEDGNLIEIDMFENDMVIRKNVYDDRGFVSSSFFYKNGQSIYTDYYTEKGYFKFRIYEADGHVEINSERAFYLLSQGEKTIRKNFERVIYDSIEAVILEVLKNNIANTSVEDIFCIAIHSKHNALLEEALRGSKTILSFFGNRYDINCCEKDHSFITEANYIIAESKEMCDQLTKVLSGDVHRIIDISPFDTRVDQGISQQLHVQKILVPIDDLRDGLLEEMIPYLAEYLTMNTYAMIYFFSRKADYGLKEKVLKTVENILEEYSYPIEWVIEKKDRNVEENLVDEIFLQDEENVKEDIPVRFFVEQCVDELEVSKCMREQRIMVDLSMVPDLYLQINCISSGIPQIVRTENLYAINNENAIVITELRELIKSLDYYLNGLTHWNEAMIASFRIGGDYTTKNLIDKWKEVLYTVGQD